MSIFGYDSLKYYNGRGAFEAMGSGISMIADYDIAFKCNFAYLNEET
jgi:2,3-bisphosphoglycerate-independent phosphoglycerate mutase